MTPSGHPDFIPRVQTRGAVSSGSMIYNQTRTHSYCKKASASVWDGEAGARFVARPKIVACIVWRLHPKIGAPFGRCDFMEQFFGLDLTSALDLDVLVISRSSVTRKLSLHHVAWLVQWTITQYYRISFQGAGSLPSVVFIPFVQATQFLLWLRYIRKISSMHSSWSISWKIPHTFV